MKLLNIVQPDRIYFGQKDYQQLLVIERMAQDLNLPVEVVSVPTFRAPDGLALSSRNAYLSTEERHAATILYRALQTARDMVAGGEVDSHTVECEMKAVIGSEPLARPDYVCLVDPTTLKPVVNVANAVSLAVLAVRIGSTRLIDNMLIAPHGLPATRPRIVPPQQ
jgi:pantoate--beta-alanine ligase